MIVYLFIGDRLNQFPELLYSTGLFYLPPLTITQIVEVGLILIFFEYEILQERIMTKPIRVRYAPSPTGLLHIGNARTALFNYLFARHHGGTFLIRIEDTDRKRHVEDGERSQLENLRWLGIDWDESPETHEQYRQSERLDIYQKYVDQLWQKARPTSLT